MKVYIFFFSEKTECIGVTEILAELEFLRALLMRPVTHTENLSVNQSDENGMEERKEETVETSVSNVSEIHVPQWDILDTDFDWFPQLPSFDSKKNISYDLLSDITMFKENHAELFFLSIGLLIAVVFGTVGLFVWLFCCNCKESKRETLVIEHPHFEDSNELMEGNSNTPLRNITPMNVAIAASEDMASSMSSISLSGFLEKPSDLPQPTLRHSKTCKNFTTEL